MEKQLPTETDMPGILRIITREAMAENITFDSIHPLDPKKDASNYFNIIEFEISMKGPLQNVVRFMSALGQQDRIFQFDRLTFVSGGSGDDGLIVTANFNLRTYAYAG